MKNIWICFCLEVLLLILLKPLINDFQLVSFVAVFVHLFFSINALLGVKNRFRMIFLGAYLARVCFLFWDLYARHIFVFPNSGADSEMFYRASLAVAENIAILNEVRGFYPKVMGLFFHLVGPQRLLAQYINVLLGLSVVFLFFRMLRLLRIRPRVTGKVLLISAFFPSSLIMSSIFLREMLPTFFIAASFYFFLKWFRFGRSVNFTFCIVSLGAASMFHSGAAGIFIGYAFVFLFYKREENTYRFSAKTIPVFLFIFAIWLFAFQHKGIFLAKFQNVEDIETVIETASSSRGGSVYLSSLTVNTPLQLVAYSPIRAFYFLTSPLPFNWRGVMDIITFIIDSSLYLLTLFYLVKHKPRSRRQRNTIIAICMAVFFVSIIFGIGVENAGTAMRHRQKLISLFLVLLAVLKGWRTKVTLSQKRLFTRRVRKSQFTNAYETNVSS